MSGFLPQVAFRWFKPDGTPAFGYTAAFFGAGLTPIQANLKSVYDQTDLVAPISQTTVLPQLGVPFDVEGKMTIVLGDGSYFVAIYNDLNVLVFSIDNVSAGLGTIFANNILALKDFSVADAQEAGFCLLLGYYNPGDDGHGIFYWDDADVTPDDGGYTITPNVPSLTGRWKRINDENGDVRAAAYGYDANTASDQTAQMIAAEAYAFANNRRLRIGLGNSALIGTMSFNANVIFEGSGIKGTGSPTIGFNAQVEGPTVKLFYDMTVTMAGLVHDVKPEWWGAVRDGATDDTAAIKAMLSSGAASWYFTAGTYLVVGDPFSAPPILQGIIRSDGQVKDGATFYVRPGFRAITVDSEVRADLINADKTVTAGTSVNAGTFLKAQAGTGGLFFKAGGTIAYGPPVANTAAVETDFVSITLPINTLLTDGDKIEYECWGKTANNANVKRFRLYFGPSTVFDTGAAFAPPGDDWAIKGCFIRQDNTRWTANWVITFGDESVEAVGFAIQTEVNGGNLGGGNSFSNFATLLRLAVLAAGASDVSSYGCVVKFIPGPV